MNKKSTISPFTKNFLAKMEHSLFDEEVAIFFRNEKLLQPGATSLKNILTYSEKTARKPNVLLC